MKNSISVLFAAAILLCAVCFPVSAQTADIVNVSNKKYCWGQGRNVNDKNQPVSCVEYNDRFGQYGAVFLDSSSDNDIYLTFDQGYENGYTSSILDTLKEKKVKAVFFVTSDYAKRNSELIKRMIAEGHVIGNHSWSHYSMPELTSAKAKEEIEKLHDYMLENYNYKMDLFRSPKGEFSEQDLKTAQSLGYKTVFWSFAYLDYDVNRQPENSAALNRVVDAAHPGAIYLLHSVSKTNAEILPNVIDSIRAKGYMFSKFTA